MKTWKNSSDSWKAVRPGVDSRIICQDSFSSLSLVRFQKGATYPLHKAQVPHFGLLVKGKGVFDFGTKRVNFEEGDSFFIHPEDDHGFMNMFDGESIVLEIFVPPRDGHARSSQAPDQQ